MKKFCESLRENAKSVTDFENKKMLSLTRKELKSQRMQKNVIFVGKDSLKNSFEIKTIKKLEIIVITQVNIEAQCIVMVI